MSRRILPAASRALLVELDDLEETIRFRDALADADLPGIVDLVPAARTVLVEFGPGVRAAELAATLRRIELGEARQVHSEPTIIPVVYDGEDLAEVAGLLGVPVGELIRRHTAVEWTVAFIGFAPGFAYQVCDDPFFNVPRRSSPRTRIPAGSVGLAGNYSGVYPRESPGGWQLLGRTPLAMFDVGRDPAVLLSPGMRVRYQVADPGTPFEVPGALAHIEAGDDALVVVNSGLQTLVQDRGRAGSAGFGVSPSGSFDRSSARVANRAVGNAPDAALLEIAMAGATLEARGRLVVAVTGAECRLTVTQEGHAERPVTPGHPLILSDGDRLSIGEATAGVRSYVAVRGGVHAPRVFGSSATDLLSGIGPSPVKSGDVLAVGGAQGGTVIISDGVPAMPPTGGVVRLDVVLGPRTDWFTEDAVRTLLSQRWTVTRASNRIGLRLNGEVPLERAITGELPSEGAVTGAIQVPPQGQPVLFGPDHPLTGGYPIIGSVADHHRDILGQLPVGATVMFHAPREFGEF